MKEKIEKSNVQEIFELSMVQKGMLFHFLNEANENLYNVQLAFRVEGAFDVQVLKQSVRAVQSQHESLRSVFRWEKVSKPLQIVLKDCPMDFTYLDMSKEEGHLMDKVKQLLEEDQLKRFDLTHLPLRFTVFKISDHLHILSITHHHILYDGWSTGILLKELFSCYKSLAHGERPELVVKPAFKEIHHALGKRQLSGEDSFWKNYLREYELTSFFSATTDYDGENAQIKKVSNVVSNTDMDAFASKHKVTKAAVIYAAYGILLQKYNDSSDVVFGTTVSNRDAAVKGNDKVIGNFINTIPLRVNNTEGNTLLDVVRTVNNDLINRSQYNYSSYFEIKKVLELKPTDDLFDSVVIIENYPLENDRINSNEDFNLQLNSVYENTGIPLVVTAFFNNEVELELAYQTNHLKDSFAKSFAAQLVRIIKEMLSDASQKTESINLISEEERKQLLFEFNNTALSYPKEKTLVTLFEEQVMRTPDQVALVFDEEELTYKELNEKANGLAIEIQKHGIKPNQVVALYTSRSLELYISLLAVLKSGGCYLPLDPTFPKERLEYMLTDTKAPLLIRTGDLENESFGVEHKLDIITVEHSELGSQPENLASVNDSEDLAYVIYTSGSTGRPKGVMLSHRAVHNYIVSMMRDVPFSTDRPIVSVTTFSFDIFVTESLLPLTQGIKVIIADEAAQKDPRLLYKIIALNGVKMIQTTPSRYKLLTEDIAAFKANMKQLECLLVGGEAFPIELLKTLKENSKARIINVYGPTETTVWSSLIDLTDEEKVTIGKPIGNTRLYVLNKHKQLQPKGVSGELYIGGDGLAHGYWNNPDLTDQVFVSDPFNHNEKLYKTGDRVRWTDDGTIEYIGRVDFQVKIRGHRIEVGEIESRLADFDSLKEGVVLAREVHGSTQLVAYYVSDETIDEEALKSFLAERLPDYMVPAFFVDIESLPMTPNGKLDKKRLPQPELTLSKNHVTADGEVEEKLLHIWTEVLGHDSISTNQNFFDVGGDSLKLISVSTKIEVELGTEISVTELFNYTTISTLARYIGTKNGDTEDTNNEQKDFSKQDERRRGSESFDIAIIGMAGRFPEASNVEEFWSNLQAGRETITRKAKEANDPLIYAKGFLREYECFDAGFFNYIPSEAAKMDPQIRIFHECTWEALEDAGYNPYRFKGAIGLYGGASANPYFNINVGENGEDDWVEKWEAITYADKDFLCPRVSYKLNLKGPSVNIATACSTSLVAIDTACQELLAGKCDMAVAGGISISLHDNEGYAHHKGMILSDDGSCRAFDEASTGTVSGNGVGMVVLKKLADSQRDGDVIHAVIKGSATNNDGHEKIGFTAPSIDGQSKAISTAIRKAGIEPESISYVETHGTGTTLGDPIEIAGLTKAFDTKNRQFCAIGSVKTNIGHLDAAAGVAGLIKTVLSLKNKQIAPSLHFNKPNPNIDFEKTPFYVNAALQEWKNGKYPRRAGISSFGIGGTNAHIILEEAPKPVESSSSREYQLLLISAKTSGALHNNVIKLAAHLEVNRNAKLADVAYTLHTGREHFSYRKAVICQGHTEAVELLSSGDPGEDIDAINPEQKLPVVFMFSGQGSQYAGMCADLYGKEAYFKEVVDNCFAIVKQLAGKDLKSIIFDHDEVAGAIDNTEFTQPALFIVEYALAQLLIKWGIKPDVMIGHSIGEYVAACISGVFSLENALKLVLKRGELMQKVPQGSMLSVAIKEEELLPLMVNHPDISLAAVNSTRLCVVSGKDEAITAFKDILIDQEYVCKLIRTSHAFHSYMMDEILEEFKDAFSGIKFQKQSIPFISNLTGKEAEDKEVSTPQYWANHLRQSVKFSKGAESALENEEAVFIEVGPGNVLSTFIRTNQKRTRKHKVINLVRHPKQESDDIKQLLFGIGELWSSGLTINWEEFYASEQRKKVSLPTYAFEKVKFPVRIDQPKKTDQPSLGRKTRVEEWFYTPAWKNTPANPVKNFAKGYLLFVDNNGPGNLLVNKLRNEGLPFIEVHKGKSYKKISDHQYIVNPNMYDDYVSLFNKLNREKTPYDHIIYNWTLTEDITDEPLSYPDGNYSNFYDLIYIVRAAHEAKCLTESHITLVTRNLQNVLGDEKVDIEQSPLLGLIKVIAQEYPVTTSHIDISWIELDKKGVDHLLFNELLRRENGMSVALRNGRKWERCYEALNADLIPEGNLKTNGVYLITGGLGELGFTLAQYLMRHYKAKVVLLGRSELPPKSEWNKYLNNGHKQMAEKIDKLKQLTAEPGKVIYKKCNISDISELKLVVESAEEQLGNINGVIHAAGTLTGSSINLISQLTKEHYEEQFEAKLKGIYNLNEVFGDRALDFCLTTSSISSLLGGLRFGAYSSANIAVDHFINALRESSKPANWITVNFDGLALNDAAADGIKTIELYKVFERLITLTYLPQIIVSVGDLNQRLQQWVKNKQLTAEDSAKAKSLTTSSIDEIEREMISLWKDYFGMDDIKASDDFFDLGGDSLKVLTMIGRIHKKFNVELSITEFFEHSTVRGLSKYFYALGEQRKAANKQDKYTVIPPAGKMDHYPLSSVQRRLYFLYEFDNASIAYNMPLALKLQGKLDLQKLETVFRGLIKRHETLRTCFEIIDDAPRQRVLEKVSFNIEYYESQRDENELISSFIKPFDLGKTPLIRVGLIKIASEEHILMVDMPHIITDGVSKSVLMKDFMALYGDRELDQLDIQYKDYAVWQQSEETRSEILRQKDFWSEVFAEEVVPLDLPTDFMRPAIKGYEGDAIHFVINKEHTKKLRAIADDEGTTLFTVLLSIYSILLGKLSNQEDIIIGTPISGRQHADLEQMMGMFINTLPLRNSPKGHLTFDEYVSQVKSRALASFDHQGYPYELLIDELDVERNTSRNPLFDALFSFENFERSTLEIPGLKVQPYYDGHIVSKFDITLTALERDELIALNFEYCTNLFKRDTIIRFINYFQNIVSCIVGDVGVKISDIELIPTEEKRLILNDFNDTETPFESDKNIAQIFEERVLERGEAIAIVFEGQSLSYNELNDKSNTLAHKILQRGLPSESVIGIMLPRSLEMIISIIAVLKAGCTYVPIDPEYPIDRIKHIAEDSDLVLLLTNAELRRKADDYGVHLDSIDVVLGDLTAAANPNISFMSSQLAYMIYTSGSTGKPKGVMIEHKNVINFVKGVVDRIDMKDTDTMLCLTTISFDIFVLETILPLLSGKKIILASASDQKNPDALANLIKEQKVDMMQITPSHLKLFMSGDESERALENVRILMVGGEAFPNELLSELKKSYRGRIYNMYGPTETTVWSAVQDLTTANRVDIGTPIANTTIRILDQYGKLQPVGIAGELCIGGEGVGRGYWKNEELTAERFMEDPFSGKGRIYRTGDMARWLPDGRLECLGRIDNQVKIRGFRIELGEIENQLIAIEEIKEAVVYTKGDDSEKFLVAYYVSAEPMEISTLRDRLAATLPEYMVPSYFMHLEYLPLTPNGKIDRKSLPAPEISANGEYFPPSTAVEERLVTIWSEVLKIESEAISINTSFFELGGNSLKAAIVVNKMFKALSVQMSLQDFFAINTVQKIAEYVENETWIKANVEKEVPQGDEFIID